jgi:hypothetical protein
MINEEQPEAELIQRAERESGIPERDVQIRDSAGQRIMNSIQGRTAWIHYGGLKGGRREVEIILQFEPKSHHLWVKEREHVRDIMLRKRYDKSAVAPMGLKGKLDGPWEIKQVIKLGRRPDVQGWTQAPLPKETPVLNPDSEKVMLWIDIEGNSTRAKFVPREMPVKEVFKKFHLAYKQFVIKSAEQPPWQNWETTKTQFRPKFTGCWEIPKTKEQEEKALRKFSQWRDEELENRDKLASEEKCMRDLYDTDMEELEEIERVANEKTRPKGDLVVTIRTNIDDEYMIEEPVAVEANDDIMEVMRKARFNSKVFQPFGDYSPRGTKDN